MKGFSAFAVFVRFVDYFSSSKFKPCLSTSDLLGQLQRFSMPFFAI